MTKSATDWRAMYRRLGEETLALRQRAETAEQERDALKAEVADLLPSMDADALMMAQIARERDALLAERDSLREALDGLIVRIAEVAGTTRGTPAWDKFSELTGATVKGIEALAALAESAPSEAD